MSEGRDRPVGIAFVGAGMVAELHAAAIARSPAARLVGFVDTDAALAARRAREWSCRVFASFDELLADRDVEAVFVLSPTSLHVEHAATALRAGRHVLVEKPVSRDPAAVMRLVRLAARKRLVCMPGHNYAYIPEYQRIRRLVRGGRLGRVRLGAIMFAIAHSEAIASHYDGVMWLVMPHHAYLMHGLFGMPTRVTAGVTEPGWQSLDHEDQAWIVLDYPPHLTVMLFTTLGADDDSADPWTFMVKVLGTAGSASESWRTAVIREAVGSNTITWVPYEEAYEHELAAFVAAVRGDPSGIASPMEEAAAVARIISAAETSVRRGRTVTMRGARGEGQA